MKTFTLMLLLVLLWSCDSGSDSTTTPGNLPAQTLIDVAYGSQTGQKMDVYLPANRSASTKIFVLIHGGGWVEGDKADMNFAVTALQSAFPDHAIVNLNYRLATAESPALPKQLEDIDLALEFVQNAGYHVSDDYAMIGASAGAHLSLLFAYIFDPDHDVKALCSIVGPTDFTDPAYTENPLLQGMFPPLVGNYSYAEHPELYSATSPALQVTAASPPTIMFYGGQDPLIPVSQAIRLDSALTDAGVYHEYNLYAEGGHGDWDAVTMLDFQGKLIGFMETWFN